MYASPKGEAYDSTGKEKCFPSSVCAFFAVYKRGKKDAEPSMGASSAVLGTAEAHSGGRKGEFFPFSVCAFFAVCYPLTAPAMIPLMMCFWQVK